jgi:hypothetical protein
LEYKARFSEKVDIKVGKRLGSRNLIYNLNRFSPSMVTAWPALIGFIFSRAPLPWPSHYTRHLLEADVCSKKYEGFNEAIETSVFYALRER